MKNKRLINIATFVNFTSDIPALKIFGENIICINLSHKKQPHIFTSNAQNIVILNIKERGLGSFF